MSHDLRTPLASIKASATTLLADDVHLDAETVHQLLQTIDEEADRLNELVSNLLDMSRLQAGALAARVLRRGPRRDRRHARLVSLGDRAGGVVVDVPGLPAPGPCRPRARRAGGGERRRQRARAGRRRSSRCGSRRPASGDRVDLRVIDRGPGIPPSDRERVFQPFQRLGDARTRRRRRRARARGRRGFTEAMGGELQLEDTPGGGTTMTFAFRAAST